MHFIFHMFDTIFYIKDNSCKKMCLVVMYSGFLTYFFQQCNLFFLFLILYLCKILHLEYLSIFTLFLDFYCTSL